MKVAATHLITASADVHTATKQFYAIAVSGPEQSLEDKSHSAKLGDG